MNSDKLFIEVMQGMQDLTRLFEKALAVERKLYEDFKVLHQQGIPQDLMPTLDVQADRLHETFIRLGACNEWTNI